MYKAIYFFVHFQLHEWRKLKRLYFWVIRFQCTWKCVPEIRPKMDRQRSYCIPGKRSPYNKWNKRTKTKLTYFKVFREYLKFRSIFLVKPQLPVTSAKIPAVKVMWDSSPWPLLCEYLCMCQTSRIESFKVNKVGYYAFPKQ